MFRYVLRPRLGLGRLGLRLGRLGLGGIGLVRFGLGSHLRLGLAELGLRGLDGLPELRSGLRLGRLRGFSAALFSSASSFS